MSATSTLSAKLGGGRLRRHEEEDQEGWLVSYADLITLLFVLFSLLLSISVVSKAKFELMTHQFNHDSAASLSELARRLETQIRTEGLQSQVRTEITDEGLQIQFNEGVLFPSAAAALNQSGTQVLASFSRLLAGMEKSFHLAVEGHTDDQPIHTAEFPSNWALSASRSVNVVHFLAAHGVDEKRMTVRAFADTRPVSAPEPVSAPVSANAHPDFRSQNRRVTLLVY